MGGKQMYDKVDPDHQPADKTDADATGKGCSCTCSCTCSCGSGNQATTDANMLGRTSMGHFGEEAEVPIKP